MPYIHFLSATVHRVSGTTERARVDSWHQTHSAIDTKVAARALQAEGALEGAWEEYMVSSPFSTNFKYSRFDATAAKPRD
eukprot:2471616-Pleurochrysis_carterae.AAC.1